jgi:TonB-dependent receptor
VQARYAFTSNSSLRLAYGRGLSRPDQYQLVPYVTEDDSTTPAQVSLGNPNLKPTHANNYDVLFEQFLSPVGMIQAGMFYKQLTDPLISTQFSPTGDFYAGEGGYNPYLGELVSQWYNGRDARIYGFEVSYQQHLTQLPGALGGIGLFANYSRTGSRIDGLPGRNDHPALQRQAPNTWNVSPTYDRGRVSVRLGLTYNGPSIWQYAYTTAADTQNLGPNGPAGDQYTYAHFQVDMQGTVGITRELKAVAYVLNLTNEVYGLYVGSPQFVRQREFYHATVAGGLRYTF